MYKVRNFPSKNNSLTCTERSEASHLCRYLVSFVLMALSSHCRQHTTPQTVDGMTTMHLTVLKTDKFFFQTTIDCLTRHGRRTDNTQQRTRQCTGVLTHERANTCVMHHYASTLTHCNAQNQRTNGCVTHKVHFLSD